MPEYEITFQGLGALMQRTLERQHDKVVLALQDAAQRGKIYVAEKSSDVPPADQGLFAAAWRVEDTQHGAILENVAPHASIVEEGARPHWPPLYPILAYVGRKRGIPTSGVSEQSGRWDLSDQPIFRNEPALESVRQIAVAVAGKIARDGNPPRYILRDAQPVFERYVQEEIRLKFGGTA